MSKIKRVVLLGILLFLIFRCFGDAENSEKASPTHIIFIFSDILTDLYRHPEITNIYYHDFTKMVEVHYDADGNHPKLTWYIGSLLQDGLSTQSKNIYNDMGEFEICISHGTEDDTNRDNCPGFITAIDYFTALSHSFGGNYTFELSPKTYFGFFHGMWALDNSRYLNGKYEWCGCNTEIDILLSKGCFGYFGFPGWGNMIPYYTNSIFVTKDTERPKSYGVYSNLRKLEVNAEFPSADELFCLEMSSNVAPSIDRYSPPTFGKMIGWVGSNIRIIGRDDWKFVMVHTSSSYELPTTAGYDNLVGNVADAFYTEIETYYNDGVNYKLHYATAREAYNICMAAVEGKTGDPNDYRDYIIPEPVNKHLFCNQLYNFLYYDKDEQKMEIEIVNPAEPIEIWSKEFTPDDYIYEGDEKDGPYFQTDADLSAEEGKPLVLKDASPSKFYLFQKDPIIKRIYYEPFDTRNDWICWADYPNTAPLSIAEWGNGKIACKWPTYPLPAPQFFQWLQWNSAHTGLEMAAPYQKYSLYILKTKMSADKDAGVPQIRFRAQADDNAWIAEAAYAADDINPDEGGAPKKEPSDFYMVWEPQCSTSDAFIALDIFTCLQNTGEVYVDDISIYRIPLVVKPMTYEARLTDFSLWVNIGDNVRISADKVEIKDTSTWSSAGKFIRLPNPCDKGNIYRLKYSIAKSLADKKADKVRMRTSDTYNSGYNTAFTIDDNNTKSKSLGVSPNEYYHYHCTMNHHSRYPEGDITVMLDTINSNDNASSITLSQVKIERIKIPPIK